MLDSRYTCPVLIGRQREVEALGRLWQAVGPQRGQTVLVAGEAGVGKSRLLIELAERAGQQGWRVLIGRCYPPDVNLPYAPLLDALRTYFHPMSRQEIASCLGPYAPELLKLLPEMRHLLPDIEPSPAVEPQAEKRRLFEAIYSFLAAAAAEHPLLVGFEDLHWADDTSLELLHVLARRIAHDPILLVTTYRTDEPVARPGTPWLKHISDLERERLATEIHLDPLDSSDVNAMVQRIFDVDNISPEFAGAIYSRTEGNPFFVEELVKALVESGGIYFSEGSWNRKAIDELNLPRSVREAILSHLHGLDASAMQVASTAAAIGRHFDFELLRSVTGLDEDTLLAAIWSLINQQLISLEQRGVDGTQSGYRFRHALTHDAIYDRLLPQERVSLHRRIAETMERLYVGQEEAHLGDLAYHLWEAGAWPKALEYSRRAGEQAIALYAPQTAIQHLERALDAARHVGAAAPLQAPLYRLRGLAHETLGDFEPARTDQEAALRMAQEGGDALHEWQSLMDLGFLWAGRDYSRAGSYFEQALDKARGMGSQLTLAHSLNRIGNWLVNTGRAAEGLQAHREALEIFEIEKDKQGTAETLDLMGMGSGIYGDPTGAVDCLGRAIELFKELGDNRGLASSHTTRAAFGCPSLSEATVSAAQSKEECAHDSAEALRISKQIGWPAGQAYAEFATGSAGFGFGDFAEGLEHAHEALRIATEIGHQQWIAGANSTLGRAYLYMLEPDLAMQHLLPALDLSRALGSQWWAGLTTGYMALAHLLKDDLASAEATLRVEISPEQQPRNMGERRMQWAWGELALAQGKPEEAIDIANRLMDSAPGAPDGRPIPVLLRLKGEALASMGRADEALKALEEALRGSQEQHMAQYTWRIHAALGRLYRQMKLAEEARQAFASAQEGIEALAATINDASLRKNFLRTASEQLPGGKRPAPRSAVPKAPAGLTPREVEILKLVATGKSNRQIAEELFVSERTVETHLTSIFAKTGADNRSSATAFAFHHNLA